MVTSTTMRAMKMTSRSLGSMVTATLITLAIAVQAVIAQGLIGATICGAVSPDGKLVASGHVDNGIRIWDVESGRLVRTIVGHRFPVLGVAFSPDGFYLASASMDRTVKVWKTQPDQPVPAPYDNDRPLPVAVFMHKKDVYRAVFSPDGKFLVSASDDNRASIWRVEEAKPFSVNVQPSAILQTKRGVQAVAVSPDAKLILTTGMDIVRLWDITSPASPKVLHEFGDLYKVSLRPFNNFNGSVAFSPDGKMIAAGGAGGVAVWDVQTQRELWRIRAGWSGQGNGVDFSPDGKFLAAGGGDAAKIFSLEGKQVAQLKATGPPRFSPDGKRLLIAGSPLSLWDVETWSLAKEFAGRVRY